MFKKEIILLLAFSSAIAENNFQSVNTGQLNHEIIKAILTDSADDIKRLALAGADINFSEHGVSPISIAVCYHKQNVIRALLDLKVRVNNDVFQSIAQVFDLQTLLEIIKSFPDQARSYKVTLISRILSTCDDNMTLEFFKNMVSTGCSTIQEIWHEIITPGVFSCFVGPKTLNFLLEYGADPNHIVTVNRETPNSNASSCNLSCNVTGTPNISCVINGPDIAYTPLLCCLGKNHSGEIVQLLISHGANVNLRAKFDGKNTTTLLSHLLRGCNPNMVNLLIAHGATL